MNEITITQAALEPQGLLDERGNILLSTTELLNIQLYVEEGLALPTDVASLRERLGLKGGDLVGF